MKKMNRKGFTLIELLAVIVVLAIILVITIPTVLNTLGNTRSDALETSANAAAEWFEKQYALDAADLDGVSSAYTTWLDGDTSISNKDLTAAVVKAAGLDDAQYDFTSSSSKITITDGRACVTLKSKANSKFGSAAQTVTSAGC